MSSYQGRIYLVKHNSNHNLVTITISDVKQRWVWVVSEWVTGTDTSLAFLMTELAIYRGQLGARKVEMGYLMRCLVE